MQELTVTQTFDLAELRLIESWLHGRGPNTRDAYLRDIKYLYQFIAPRGLRSLTLFDLQAFSDSMSNMADTTRARRLSAAKSLLNFMYREEFLPKNPGLNLRLPEIPETLSERILSEEQVVRMLALETNKRNHAILSLLYHAGLRVSELCSLTWRNLQQNRDAGQVSVLGKGDKSRSVPIKKETYQEILALRPAGADLDAPVFTSQGRIRGLRLSRIAIHRIVKEAALRAGIAEHVSPHWLRHAHASHAIDHNAPMPLVRDTLGHSNVKTTNKYLHARPGESSAHYLTV